MRFALPKAVQLAVAVIASAGMMFFGFTALAAWSDFLFRGCDTIPSSSWDTTANCTDAFDVGWAAGIIAAAFGLTVMWAIWRLQHDS